MKQIKTMVQRGLMDPEKEDPFALFVASTNIRYSYYSESHKILGNTFGMCVLQDFEALTPNLLARTIETVEGGGMIVLLLSNLQSLTQLYHLSMDVHSRLRTESHGEVVGRFNERFILSLASNPNCLMVDDELNVLPTSSLVRAIEPLPADHASAADVARGELKELSDSLTETLPAGPLVAKCRTMDQARAVVTFLDAATEKTLRSTVALTASRGRGKSASLGLAIAGALGLGYSNIFVSAPSPENLKTLFEFIFKGLDALGYREHLDYSLVESSNAEWGKSVVRVNVFKDHRQTVQYIRPQDYQKLGQAELLIIDEAAAIPLPIVKKMLGPYLTFLCSTVNGYEGTGRSLSLKLIQQLREQGSKAPTPGTAATESDGAGAGRTFREVKLTEPIRYAPGDRVERWLHELLCLDATEHVPKPPTRLPHPDECELYYVNRDTLFSYHKASEAFLQRMMSLYVSSHYKNTPNDLILMSDAPAHHMFALLGPVDETQNVLPDILCVVQVALEGAISRKSAMASLAQGQLPQGDLIPWTVGQQFQDTEFPGLSGARVVRIAVHPDLAGGGYGSRAVKLLERYYSGQISGLEDDDEDAPSGRGGKASTSARAEEEGGAGGDLLSEKLKPRQGLPPLLSSLAERKNEKLQYLGVSFGLTQQLYTFWNRSGYAPVYLRQTPSDVTGEYTVIMLRPLEDPDLIESTEWIEPFTKDFKGRFMSLLAGPFRDLQPALALSILAPKISFSEAETQASVEKGVTVYRADQDVLSPYDLKRLQAYSNNLVDHHMIGDLVPSLARAFFAGRVPATLTYGQAAIILCLGLQQKDVSAVESSLDLPSSQVLALFNKTMRKLFQHLRASKASAIERTLPRPRDADSRALLGAGVDQDLDAELEEGARAVQEEMKEKLKLENLGHFAIRGGEDDFKAAMGKGEVPRTGVVSVKAAGPRPEAPAKLYKKDDKKRKDEHGGSRGGGDRGGKKPRHGSKH